MRGENLMLTLAGLDNEETPPHAWRKPEHLACDDRIGRNISTCVEKTSHPQTQSEQSWKHLHMRGENLLIWRSGV